MIVEFVLYMKENCSLCEDAKVVLDLLKNEYLFEYREKDIYTDEELLEKYHLSIPVLEYRNHVVDEGNIDYFVVENFLRNNKLSENS
ncbi:glutaredoxin [Gracilibacillus halotolerans]|uniref:Glutaredoxin n=1 Tax=Gracilibacillus halotolerans TaxID=74386 RepID=A0A841RS28_9BACI|nr:glutaredoxin family protein [Gracilibacillus halotolerans]MBB6513744.1 glutaredoxin [Gracilibacillus halotolerans]